MAILIVDDDEEYLRYLERALSQEGHKPLLAATGAAARRIIEAGGLSLVLMDLRLPDSSGLELMTLARNADPLTVCIAMTALVSEESAMEALRLGAYDYLLKPTGIDAVKAAVRRGVEHYRLRAALIERTAQMGRFKTQSQHANDLMGLVSEKLKDPLNIVCGYASFLADNDAPEPDLEAWRQGIKKIRDNAVEIRAVLNAFL